MVYYLSLILVAALGFALKRLRDQRRAIGELGRAIAAKRPYLREERIAALGRDWDRLCADINDVVAERNRLQQQRSGQVLQLEATLGSLQEAVLMVDDGNYIVLANGALEAIFPRVRHILRQRLDLVLHSRDFLAYVEAVRSRQAEPRREVEFVEGAASTWVEATGALIPPLDGGKGSWAIFVLHDITQQRKLENVRRDFVANVSHELRTPLSVIKGYIETLVDDQHMAVVDRARFLETIQRHTLRLDSLIEDLLALSRLESANPGLNPEPADLGKVVADVVEALKVRPDGAGHSLDVDLGAAPPRVMADPMKIAQVFENLIENALKYTPRGSVVRIAAIVREQEVEFSVKDNGPGIPPNDLPHIFERFYRVEKGRSREKGGTGLGLSIVKHIVQLHGGRVWAESPAGGGAAFHFTLPLQADRTVLVTEGASTGSGGGSPA